MVLPTDLDTLIRSFLPPKRSLASILCLTALGLQDLLYTVGQVAKRLTNLQRYGAQFGTKPSCAALMARFRLAEQVFHTVGLARLDYRPRDFGPTPPVLAYVRVLRCWEEELWDDGIDFDNPDVLGPIETALAIADL